MAVRIKSSGVYQDDIGVIDDINIDDKSLTVRLVPRLGQYKKGSHKMRPTQKLFQPDEHNIDVAERVGNEIFYENKKFIKGFLLKKYKFYQVSTDNVRLSVEQKDLFNRFTEDGEDRELARTLFEQ